jgi:class 3 adenylate cyclase/tetratricopeptide (TPR) repeat protein
MLEREQLEQAIAAQEALRETLGDGVVDATIVVLRERLAQIAFHDAPDQRKLVTILFADTVASTAMSEHLDPEDVLEIMDGALKAYTNAVNESEGTVARLMGDGLLAFFGAPIGREDDPVRAVRCGLALIRAAKEYARDVEARWGISGFDVRVGVNTGLVALGEVGGAGGSEWTAMGDAINLASRLQNAAPTGGVLISYDTYRHVRGLFEIKRLDALQVKGKSEAVQVYLVEREKPRTFLVNTRGVEGIETPMVGRADELQQLQETFAWAVEESETQVITILGEPGVGKSRLLREFDNWIDELPESVLHFTGRATSEMVNLPYAMMRNVFVFRFQIHDSDNTATVCEKLERGIAGFMGEESARKAHYIGHLLGFDFSNSPYLQGDDRQHLTQLGTYYITEFFDAAAADNPTVMLLDDIQWADDKSLDLINHIVRVKRGLKMLLVCIARPSLFERRPPLWNERHEFHSYIELRPLTKSDTRKLACDILCQLDTVPPELLDTIVKTADGNPYYVEELIKMMLDDEVILKDTQHWWVDTSRLTEMKIPPTLTGVLQARLDTLPPDERTMLQRASVIGRIFWDSAVTYLHAEGENPITNPRDCLMRLRRRELIRGREQSTFDGAKEYIFKHTILRDVTYESVLKRQRRIYHEQVADWLVERSGDRINEYTGLIAEHYERAGQDEKALMYLTRAAEQALAISAYREAISLLEKALGVVKEAEIENTPQLEGQIKLQLGQAYRGLSAYDRAKELYEESLQLFVTAKHDEGIVRALYELGWQIGYIMRRYDEGEEYMQESLAIARSTNDKRGIAWALNGMGVLAQWRGWYTQAIRCYEESLTIAREIGDMTRTAGALNNIGLVKIELGLFDEARPPLEESLHMTREMGRRAGMISALNNLGRLAQYQGQPDEARKLYNEALAISKEISDRSSVAMGLWTLGVLARLEGDYEDARRQFNEALSIAREINFPAGIGSGLQELALIARLQGNYAQARQHVEESLALAREVDDQPEIANALLHLGGIMRLAGSPQEARHVLEESVILNMNIGNQRGVAQALRFLGDTALVMGDYDDAHKFYGDSLAIHREFDNRSGMVLTLCGLGYITLAKGEIDAAKQHFEDAYQMAAVIHDMPLTLWILAGISTLLAKTGEEARSLELAGLVLNHFASPQEARDRAAAVMTEVQSEDGTDELAAALERGRELAKNASRGQLGVDDRHWITALS